MQEVWGNLIGDVLNLLDVQTRKIVEAKNVKQIVMELLKDEATVAIIHKRVSWRTQLNIQFRIYPIVARCTGDQDPPCFATVDTIEFQFSTMHYAKKKTPLAARTNLRCEWSLQLLASLIRCPMLVQLLQKTPTPQMNNESSLCLYSTLWNTFR